MKAVLKGNDLEAVFASGILVELAPFARQLDRTFVGFSAAIGEEHPIKAGVLGQHRSKLDRGLVKKSGRGVNDLFCLRHQGILQALWRVTEAVHRPALQPVEITLAVMVGQPHAAAFGEYQRRPVGDVQQRLGRVLGEGGIERFWFIHGSVERQATVSARSASEVNASA